MGDRGVGRRAQAWVAIEHTHDGHIGGMASRNGGQHIGAADQRHDADGVVRLDKIGDERRCLFWVERIVFHREYQLFAVHTALVVDAAHQRLGATFHGLPEGGLRPGQGQHLPNDDLGLCVKGGRHQQTTEPAQHALGWIGLHAFSLATQKSFCSP